MKKIITIVVIAVILSSCNDARKELSITFVFDKPISATTKYPTYFSEIVMPFKSNCEVDYLLKPINISRLDISNKVVETNAWYFKDMGDNTVEFSKGWLEQYFKDSLVNSYLLQPSTKTVSIDDWITNNKDSLFIYSEEAQSKEYKGRQIFTTAKELNAKIQELACGNTSGKVIVLINPSILSLPPTDTNTFVPPIPIVGIKSDNEFLRKALLEIANTKLSFDQRLSKVNEVMKTTFSKDLVVESYINNAGVASHLFDKGFGRQYLENLARDKSIIDFNVLAHKDSIPNISYLQVIEIHKQ